MQMQHVTCPVIKEVSGGWNERCRWLIFIDTPEQIRQRRVLTNRGWSETELARRESTQWSLVRKKDMADFIVDNSGSIQTAAQEMQQVFESIQGK